MGAAKSSPEKEASLLQEEQNLTGPITIQTRENLSFTCYGTIYLSNS
jgi:hypothetical protein